MTQRILVVEDDARIADLITRNLAAAGYECHVARDGAQALADFAAREGISIPGEAPAPAARSLDAKEQTESQQ